MRLGTLPRRPRPRLARASAAAAALLLVITGCIPGLTEPGDDGGQSGVSDAGGEDGGDGDDAEDEGPALAETAPSAAQDLPGDPATDPAYAAYYEQSIDWGECEDVESYGEQVECGTVTVPLVWNDPGAGDIDIAVLRSPGTGADPGSLFINPGGPGGSGVDFAASSATYLFSPEVRAEYDVIGFDPRGVSRSAGIECLSDEEIDEQRSLQLDMGTPEGLQEAEDLSAELAAACQETDGEVLPYLDTTSAARDLDVLRAAAGSEQLDYLGFSYGTYLGATYAELYPDRVGKFVLDSALDPTVTLDELSAGQAAGFEQATATFLEDCLSRGEECPFKGGLPEAEQQLAAFFESVDAEPLDTGDPERPLTGSLARSAVMLLMYQDELWEAGRMMIGQAMAGDGEMMLNIADLSADRQEDGSYQGNSALAITAINCLDHPAITDMEWQQQQAATLAEDYPIWGSSFGYGNITCGAWPVQPLREPAPIAAEGSGPILVVGVTGDAATPYEWSQSLAEQLDEGVLLTWEGNGHTAYGRSGGCIEAQVDAYLLEDIVPEDGFTC
ncbi:MAG TPA: alpha/beta hydrolase [Candidatus Brachybacterium merdigallinarum]|nr:alpha/beta hydrolase [Candidatus Brachybacterium merdigallinarum]